MDQSDPSGRPSQPSQPGPVDPRPFSVALSDGSVCRVEATGPMSSVVARMIANRPVWAEHVSGPCHPDQVDVMVASMAAAPGVFLRFGDDPFESAFPPISSLF